VTPPNRRSLRLTEHEVGIAVLSFDIAPGEARAAPEPEQRDAGTLALTPAQRKVGALAVRGRTNAEIARELGISPRTVANHMSEILKRTGATSRYDLARKFSG